MVFLSINSCISIVFDVNVISGHFAKWEYAPPETLAAFVEGLTKIPSEYAVFWQFNGQQKPTNLPKNIQLHKWLPQKELLSGFFLYQE